MDFRDTKSRLILIVVALGAVLVVLVASCGGFGDDGGGADDGGNGQPTQSGASDGEGGSEGGSAGEGDSGGGGEEPTGEPGEPLAEVTGGEDLTLTVTKAERESGGFLTVEGNLHNGGSDMFFDLAWAGDESELAENGFSMAGASLVAIEEGQGRRYLILRDTEGRCLCTLFGNGIDDGATVTWFAQFPAPDPAVTQVQFQVGDLPPATVEIG